MKSKRMLKLLKLLSLVGATTMVPACGGGTGDRRGGGDAGGQSGFVELMANDPLRHTFSFGRGAFGSVIQDNTIRNSESDIEYSNYYAGELSVGIQGGESGVIVDLGSDDSVASQLGVTQTLGSGQGYAHLVLSSGRFSLPAANTVLDTLPPEMGHAKPQLGHVYVVRVVDPPSQGDPVSPKDLLVKLLVVGLREQHEVAFEWERLNSR